MGGIEAFVTEELYQTWLPRTARPYLGTLITAGSLRRECKQVHGEDGAWPLGLLVGSLVPLIALKQGPKTLSASIIFFLKKYI